MGLYSNGTTNCSTDYNDVISNVSSNCFYDIRNNSQHAKGNMKMKVTVVVINSTIYDGNKGVKIYNNNNNTKDKNTNNHIFTTQKHLKVGVRVTVMIKFIAIEDNLSLFQCRKPSDNNIIHSHLPTMIIVCCIYNSIFKF